jgi:hypothetical protein
MQLHTVNVSDGTCGPEQGPSREVSTVELDVRDEVRCQILRALLWRRPARVSELRDVGNRVEARRTMP